MCLRETGRGGGRPGGSPGEQGPPSADFAFRWSCSFCKHTTLLPVVELTPLRAYQIPNIQSSGGPFFPSLVVEEEETKRHQNFLPLLSRPASAYPRGGGCRAQNFWWGLQPLSHSAPALPLTRATQKGHLGESELSRSRNAMGEVDSSEEELSVANMEQAHQGPQLGKATSPQPECSRGGSA